MRPHPRKNEGKSIFTITYSCQVGLMGITSITAPRHSQDASSHALAGSGRTAKFLWNAAGTFFLFLGIVGIAVPLLPTTPFLLLAASCYLRGSARMYKWLMTNKYFGEYLKDYRDGRGMPLKVKIGTVALLWAVITFSAMFATSVMVIRIGMFVVATGVTIHIVTLKTKRDPDSV